MPSHRISNAVIDPVLLRADQTRFAEDRQASSEAPRSRSTFPATDTSSPTLGAPTSDWEATSDELALLHKRILELEAIVDHQNWRLTQHDYHIHSLQKGAGCDADEESDGEEVQLQKKRKRASTGAKILTDGKQRDLTEEQKKTRVEIQEFLDRHLKSLSGTPHNSNVPDGHFDPGEHKVAENHTLLIPDFDQDVTDWINKRLITQAAHLVFKEQMDAQTQELSFPDVAFTLTDVESLAKGQFRAWKKAYKRQTDEEVAKKVAQSNRIGKRAQRKRQLKSDRLAVKKDYLLTYGADPEPLLLTDWMSDLVSELDSADEQEKVTHRARMLVEGGYSLLGDTSDIVIWEQIRPAFRSAEVNTVYKQLDRIRRNLKLDARKKRQSFKRVYLNRVSNLIPSRAPFPFMVDEQWHREFVAGKSLEQPFVIRRNDPQGFGSRKGAEDSGNEYGSDEY